MRFLVFAAALLLAGCARGPSTPEDAASPPAGGTARAGAPVRADSTAEAPLDSTSAVAAEEVVRAYYAAIDAGDYRRAYGYWGDDGARSGQSFETFRDGFTETQHVRAEVGAPGRVEGAAGSRYVEVPVTLQSTTTGGRQHFEGTYTLRRAVVDGATPAQQRWHLYDADVAEVE